MQLRVAVKNPDGSPAMPTKCSRARRWVKEGKATEGWNDLGQYYVQLASEPSGRETQPIVVGVDPGKLFTGIAAQSLRFTLFLAHLELPFETVRKRMEQRRMMRRGRRGRRINRKVPFNLRAHRQKRFDNRKQRKVPPSIRANRQLEIRVVKELCNLFPVSRIVFEYVRADVDKTSGRKGARSGKGFSPVMVGQKWAVTELSKLAPVRTQYGYETKIIRDRLGLVKVREKSAQTPQSHAVDGIALAASEFISYQSYKSGREHGHVWQGQVDITPASFVVIRRPPISRRQLHLMVPAKGGERRKYGGTVTRHGVRKGDFVRAVKGNQTFYGWVSGDTEKQVSVSDIHWKRIAQFTATKVTLLKRSTGLLVERLG